MKKQSLIAALLFILCSAVFADVFIKDIDGTNVEIVFTFAGSPATQTVNLAGTMNGWSVDATPMVKNAQGIWEYVLSANVSDEVIYKFVINGTSWIHDENAPDECDDGFGGKNGLISVSTVLALQAGKEGTPNSASHSASNNTSASEHKADKVFASKLTFGMETHFGSSTLFSTQGARSPEKKSLEVDDTSLIALSTWKIRGDIVPDVYTNFEITFFDGVHPLWAQDARGVKTVSLDKSIPSLLVGLLTSPANFFNGGKNPNMKNKLRVGFNTPYVNIETARGDYAMPGVKTFFWDSVYGKNAGDGGWLRFELGPKLRQIRDVTIGAVFLPNRAGNGNYGLTTWVNVAYDKYKAEIQYSYESKEKISFSKMFSAWWGHDLIFGASASFGSFSIKGQALFAFRSGKPFKFQDLFAYQMEVAYAANVAGVSIGYQYTGETAGTLYGSGTGDPGTQRIFLTASTQPLPVFKLGFESNVRLMNKNTLKSDVAFFIKPYFDFNLGAYIKHDSWINIYTKLLSHSRPEAGQKKFLMEELGLKFYMKDPFRVMKVIDVYYGWKNNDPKKMLHTLALDTQWAHDIRAQVIFGLRLFQKDYSPSEREVKSNNAFGFAVGISWKVPAKAIKNPVVYGNFGYNLDPFQGGTAVQYLALDGFYSYKDKGIDHMNGKALLRFGIIWNF